MLKTGSWSSKLPSDHVAISISRGTPKWLKIPPLKIPELVPGSWLFSVDVHEYHARYSAQLSKTDAAQLVEKIDRISQGRIPVLCCFCKPSAVASWCHRALASEFLCLELGLVVEEFGLEGQGYGADHPMLPAEYRRDQGPKGRGASL